MLPENALSGSQRLAAASWMRWLLCVLFGLLLGVPYLASAQDILPVPALTARVIDQTGTLTEADKAVLEVKLQTYEQAKGSQIVVLMVPTTQPEDIAAYAYRVASTWKIGRRDVGDGVLLVIAKNDRRMRIEVAKKLEGVLPDLAVARIMDQTMRPQFRYDNYVGGISAALEQIMQAIDSENLPMPSMAPQAGEVLISGSQGIDWMMMLVIVVMVSLIGGSLLKTIMGRGFGSITTGALSGGIIFLLSGHILMAVVAGTASFIIALFSGMMGGGGGGGSGMSRGRRSPVIISSGSIYGGGYGGYGAGDGGYSSGGGGDFGGGGASGDW